MKIVKIDRGHVEVEIEGYVLNIAGEAMLPEPPPGLSGYILYKNSLRWLKNNAYPKLEEEVLFTFLEKEFLKRNLLLRIE